MNTGTDKFNTLYQELRLLELSILAEYEKKRRGESFLGRGDQLEIMLKQIRTMKDQIKNKTLPPIGSRIRGMASMVVDSWPLDSKLGEQIVSAENAFLRLHD